MDTVEEHLTNVHMPRNNTQIGIREVLFVQVGGEISSQVQQAVREKRYVTKVVSGIEHIKSGAASFSEPILVFEAGPSAKSLADFIEQFTKRAAEFQMPIIVIGDDADRYERELDGLFPAATTLNMPYGATEILAAINYISRTYVEKKRNSLPAQKQAATRSDHVHASAEAAKKPSLADLVFTQLEKLDLVGKEVGGDLFSSPDIDEALLVEHNMFPSDEKLQETIRELCESVGPWGGSHLMRTSYMAQKIVGAMGPDQQLLENLKSAAFLFSLSFAGNDQSLMQRAYLAGERDDSRRELSGKIKESAASVTSTLKNKQVSAIISTMASFVGEETPVKDDDMSITASAIMAADITGRICYATGHWNPRSAHILFSQLRKGGSEDFHPSVLCCTVKFLAEAISARTPLFLLKKELRSDDRFMAMLHADALRPAEKGQQKIPLSSLVPGMRLMQPLKALDGREILSNDLVLDEDLIWRIWQLSAIRPMRKATILSAKS